MRCLHVLYFVFVLFSGVFANAQNDYKSYYELINKASKTDDFNQKIDLYQSAFTVASPLSPHLKSISFQYFKTEDLKTADEYFLKAVENGFQFEIDEHFKSIPLKIDYSFGYIKSPEDTHGIYNQFLQIMKERNLKEARQKRKQFLERVDPIQNEIYEVFLQNEYGFQNLRLEILPQKNLTESELQTISKYANSDNSYLMLNLLKKGDFPDRKLCARFNDQTITLLLNHAIAAFANEDDAEEFITLLWNEVETGNLTPYDYAKAYDHYISWYVDDTKTYFGTTSYWDDLNKPILIDVLYPEKLNEIRQKHWLGTIEDWSSGTGFALPINYRDIQKQ